MVSAGVFAALIALEAVVGSYFPSRTQLAAHWFRSDAVAFCMGAAALTALVLTAWTERDESLPSLLLALVAFMHIVFVPAAMLLFIVAFDRNRRGHVDGRRSWAVSCALCVAGAAALASLRLLELYATMPVFLMLVAAVGYLCRMVGKGESVVVALVVALLAVTVVRDRSRVLRDRAQSESGSTAHQMHDLGLTVQRMVPRDGLLLVPPSLQVRPFFRRSVYLSMKDTAAVYWQPGFETEFLRRLKLLGISYTPGSTFRGGRVDREFYDGLPDSLPRVSKEGVTHVVLPVRELRAEPAASCLTVSNGYCLAAIDAISSALNRKPL